MGMEGMGSDHTRVTNKCQQLVWGAGGKGIIDGRWEYFVDDLR